jgi:hypothetical protein
MGGVIFNVKAQNKTRRKEAQMRESKTRSKTKKSQDLVGILLFCALFWAQQRGS